MTPDTPNRAPAQTLAQKLIAQLESTKAMPLDSCR